MADPTGSRSPRPRRGRRRSGTAAPRPAGGRWRLNTRWKKALAVGVALFLVGILSVGGLVAYSAATLPDINAIGQATGTIKILDSHGTLLAEIGHKRESRRSVPIDQIAPLLQQATIAAEDRTFYSEGAFNPTRVLKALVDDLILRRAAYGASTITQQLAKQAFFGGGASKSPLRKVQEALLANQIDSKFTKQEILDQYLNITYYGENAYGIESASQRYFGKHAKDLTLPEAALLAGLPQAPSFNDPYQNPDAAYSRMHYVLGSLVAVGQVKQADADAVDPLVGGRNANSEQQAQQQTNRQSLTADLANGQSANNSGPAPHFVQYIQDQLPDIFGQDPQYLQGDLTVNTTLDLNLQNQANKAVVDGVNGLKPRGATNGALLMIDSRTGNIQAMVGSANFNDRSISGQYNIVTASRRPGSSFKPYVYEEGFKSGIFKPDSILQDTRSESQKLGGVPDFDGNFLGPLPASRALVLSRNVATEQAMQMAGVQNVINFAYGMGICTCTPQEANLSTGIGTSAVRMIDHTSAYAAFANGGHKVVARGILKITDGTGAVLRDFTQAPGYGDTMTPAQAWAMTAILRNYAKQWNLKFKYDTAGKSGTTDNYVDAYYMTYTPDWVVASWTGHTSTQQGEEGMDQVFGTSTGAAIAVPFVNGLSKPSAFQPVNGPLTGCSAGDTGQSSASGCPSSSPSASSTPTPTDTPSAPPSQSASAPPVSFSPGPTPILPTPTPRPTPSPKPTPSPTVAAGASPANLSANGSTGQQPSRRRTASRGS
ncbi:MAG: penicillin-binding protein [Candidatus Dormibacteraeota bacterium]|uniref:Penicillin-binding protein n=1 Tax=Candidatus Amunia macphersoniae TaxID=3127014 RepID=A0A934KMM0_9BACT|nr:penicillin-binding protein [Candidatus Dormibacteraeota bacterium]